MYRGQRDLKLVTGNSHPDLARKVCEKLGLTLTDITPETSASGEISIRIRDSVAGADVYVIQPTCASSDGTVDINAALMELLFLIRRLKLGGAASVTAVVPFYAYARQDRKTDLRVPLSAAAVSTMIGRMGVDRVVTIDLHCAQIQGCFCDRAPMDNLPFAREFASHIRKYSWFSPESCVVVSPDAGGLARARHVADLLHVVRVVTILKRRAKAGDVESMQTVGDVNGLNCVIIDDMCDTGGTLVKAAELLVSVGAQRVVACCTHGILTDPCCERVNKCSALTSLVVSNSISQTANESRCTKLEVIPIENLLSTAVMMLHEEKSLSQLFDAS
jgi:ribose-phosphate pyrophosphokinase